MAEEEVVAPVASPISTDHKRKLEEVEPEAPERTDLIVDSNAEHDEEKGPHDKVESESPDVKRPRLDDNPDTLESENGVPTEKFSEQSEQDKVEEDPQEPTAGNGQAVDGQSSLEEVKVTTETEEVKVTAELEEAEVNTVITEEQSADDHNEGATQEASVENVSYTGNTEEPIKEETEHVNDDRPQQEINDTETTIRKIEVPSSKVGVLIGKRGDTIRYLQYNSGAKIQIMRDAEANPSSSTRVVELIGALASIEKAEKLISAVIDEADAGGSPSLVARGLPSSTAQAAGAVDQIEIQVPNEKVGIIIGRGGENIKSMQTKSGARIQLIPQHLPEGDGSKERTVRVTGDKRQIDMAKELINDVMNQTVRSSSQSSGFDQQTNRPRGPTGPPQWDQRGPNNQQSMGYDYQQRGQHASRNNHYQPPSYGSFPPQQMAPRHNYGSGWEQRPSSQQQGPPPRSGGYDYYGAQGHGPAPGSTPNSGHVTGHSPSPAIGPPPSQANYNYGQQQGPDNGRQASYPQNYGHMYEEPKYENHAPMQQPYGGGSQTGYPQTGGPQGYGTQQQYGKPLSYGTQQPPNQTYGAPAPQSYSQSAPHQHQQQQYPYATGGQMQQQTYPPYGSVQQSDGYNNQAAATGQGYAQQGGQQQQPVPNYSQPGGQQGAGYGQGGPTGGYASYPSSQQGYIEQPGQNAASYGYQAPQDPTTYGSVAPSSYGAAPSGQQVYPQATSGQAGYDQSASQQVGGYVAPQASIPQATQPGGYPSYDASQTYAAPH